MKKRVAFYLCLHSAFGDKWEEDWIRIGYGCYDGDIISIYVLDVKAAGFR